MSNSSSTRSSTSTSSRARRIPRVGLSQIQAATNNFHNSNIIRVVESAITYKGVLDGETIAVKRFDIDSNVVEDFRKEIEMLGKYNHNNIVSVIGKCEESQEMIIVHEFMVNETLAKHLAKKGSRLSWEKILKICLDIAQALEYLHNQTANSTRIIHRNLNPNNIWLGENWEAKISDFGYARIGRANTINSETKTDVKGSISHLDPYYNLTGQLTRRTDTFALGVVMLELLCWRPAFDPKLEDEKQKLAKWAQTCLKNGSLNTIVDSGLKAEAREDCLKEFARLANSCLHDEPHERPKMSKVIEKLDSLLTTYYSTRPSASNLSTSSSSNSSRRGT